MQLQEFFPALLKRFESFAVIDPKIEFGAGITFRGPAHLHMRFVERADVGAMHAGAVSG